MSGKQRKTSILNSVFKFILQQGILVDLDFRVKTGIFYIATEPCYYHEERALEDHALFSDKEIIFGKVHSTVINWILQTDLERVY